MKKIFKTMSVLMCGLVMTTGFAACSNNDDDDENKPKEEQQQPADQSDEPIASKVTKITAYYEFKTSEDLLSIFNMKMEYVDPVTGERKSEPITQTFWSKSFEPKLPFATGMNLTTTLKDGVDLETIRETPEYKVIVPVLVYGVYGYDAEGKEKCHFSSNGDTSIKDFSGETLALAFEKGLFHKSFYNTYDKNCIEEQGKWQ